MTMQAIIIHVQQERLLVLDLRSGRRVVVNTHSAHRFRPGQAVRIRYSGAMTKSIPPQIYARHIAALPVGGRRRPGRW